ncbi:MAG: hypothetical protein Q9172_003472 [Xanthocarpia lactea]
MPSKIYPPNHHSIIIKSLLIAIQKQQDIMEHLTRDLEFFRNKFKESLDYDNGTGCYLADVGDETIDLRSHMDLGNGIIGAETAVDYVGYRSSMNNFQMGFEKTKDEIEKIWKVVDLVRDTERDQLIRQDSMTIPKWEAEALEKGRKAAAQE